MKHTHLEHPEDSILSGNLSVLDWFTSIDNEISAKIAGSPAIVWGTNPANKKFFVGTKSVFNKKLIKINHSHKEIDKNHTGFVAKVLHACLIIYPSQRKYIREILLDLVGIISIDPILLHIDSIR